MKSIVKRVAPLKTAHRVALDLGKRRTFCLIGCLLFPPIPEMTEKQTIHLEIQDFQYLPFSRMYFSSFITQKFSSVHEKTMFTGWFSDAELNADAIIFSELTS